MKNKRLEKYLEEHQDLNNIREFKCEDNGSPVEYLRVYFAQGCLVTYYRDGGLQCISYCNRSFIDLYMITRAKYPEITMEEVAYILLYELGHEGDGDRSHSSIKCPTVKKVVFCAKINMSIYAYKSFQGKNSRSRYGAASTVGVDGLCYNSILSMANRWIKKQNKLQNNG